MNFEELEVENNVLQNISFFITVLFYILKTIFQIIGETYKFTYKEQKYFPCYIVIKIYNLRVIERKKYYYYRKSVGALLLDIFNKIFPRILKIFYM